MTTDELINLVADLAKVVDNEDPIDFAMLTIDDESVWHLMATNVVEQYLPLADNKVVIMATITKLVVENFILNMRLMSNK
jgi:hypothetical protein